MNNVLKTAVTVVAASFAAMALAQMEQRPVFSRSFPKAIKDSTTRYVPQINDSVRTRGYRSENAPIFTPLGDPNTLVAGDGISGTQPTLGPKFRGIEFTGAVPPDCDISVGPTQIVAVVNTDWAIFNRAGNKLFQQSIDSFFSTQILGGITSDPKVFYDTMSKRWFMSIINIDFNAGESWQLLAVSETSSAQGNWFKYKINTEISDGGTDFWLDYPNFGFNKDGVVISGNYFGYTNGFFGGGITVLPKAPLLAGNAGTASYFKPAGGTIQLTRTTNATAGRVYGVQTETRTSMKMFAFENFTTTPTMVTTSLAVPQWDFPRDGRSTGGQPLDGLDGRLLNCYLRGGKIVTSQGVGLNGDNVVRWYDINVNNWPSSGQPTLFQSGTVKAPQTGMDAFMPAINVNALGDIAVVYTVCSPNVPADLYVNGRKTTDARGAMGRPKKIASSLGSTYQQQRWGDYFGIEVDPVDNQTFWAFGMVINNSGTWTTEISSFKISTGTGGSNSDTVAPTSATMFEGTQSFGTFSNLATSNDSYFTVASRAVTRVGQVASAELSFTLPRGASSYSDLQVNVEGAAASTLSSSVFAYDWANAKYVYVGAFPLTSADARNSIKITSGFAAYLNSTRQVKLLIRAVSPATINRAPLPFNFRKDQVQLVGNLK